MKKKSKYIHCRICGRAICKKSLKFKTRMGKVRNHYKRMHYSAFRDRIRKGAMKRSKGQISIVGILSIMIVVMVFALTLDIQTQQVENILAMENVSSTTKLVVQAFIPVEAIGILMGIVYYASQARGYFRRE